MIPQLRLKLGMRDPLREGFNTSSRSKCSIILSALYFNLVWLKN